MADDIVDEFDKRVASAWIVIALGAGKTLEQVVKLLAVEVVDVAVLGLDVSLLAVYATLTTAGTTGLIAWRTIGN